MEILQEFFQTNKIMNKSRLAIFYQHMPPFPGGAALRGEAVVRALGMLFQDKKNNLQVITAVGDSQLISEIPYCVLPNSDIENSASLPRRLIGELLLGWRAGRQIVRLNPDGALISSPAFLSALVATWWCRWRKVPYVLDVRDVYPQVYAHAGLLKESSFPYKILLAASRGMYCNARNIVTVTDGLVAAIKPLAGNTPIDCIYNGFPASLATRRPEKHARFTLCFHGVLGYFQDIETLCALAIALENYQIDIVVIGYGRKELLLKQINTSNLRFLGRLPFEKTIDEVAKCHVGLCLRRDDDISKDAFPIKVWEYMALGMPCVVTPFCEAGEFLERHSSGIQIQASDIDSLMREILSLRDTQGRLESMSSSCERAAAGYTREKLGGDVAQLVAKTFTKSISQ